MNIHNERAKLKEALINKQSARDTDHVKLQIELAELKKEKDMYEVRTKQELTRLENEVSDMIAFEQQNA
jgi:hypothetical protein